MALGLLCMVAVAIGVFAIRDKQRANDTLPPLSFAKVEGTLTPVIDSVALRRCTEQHQIPVMPDLSDLSMEAARDIHGALGSVVADRGSAATWGRLGRVLQSHKYPAEALACYTQANTLAPNAHEWDYYRGRIHADIYEFGPAIKAYARAAQLNPNYAPTFLALGNLYLQSGDAERAHNAYQRLVKLRPQSSHGYLGLAQIAFDRQDYESVIQQLGNALRHNPDDFRAHNLLGQTHQQLGQTQKASYHLGIVKSLDRRNQLTKQVFYDDPLYYEMLASNTTDAAVTDRMRAAMATGQTELAIRLGEELCRRHPNEAERFNALANAYKKAKRFADGLACAKKAVSLDPELGIAHLTEAQLLLVLRRNSEALKLLDRFVARYPDSFDGHYNHGAAQALAGQYEAAVLSFRHAVRLQQSSARAHVALAESLTQIGQRAEALQSYRRALELDPANARARQLLFDNRE